MSGFLGAIESVVTRGLGNWIAALRPASFRGVGFHVDSSGGTTGRRAALHEYPGRDVPYVEDLGRKAWSFTFDAYVIGPGHLLKRDLLLAACRAKGPGALVYPTMAAMQAVCVECSFTEQRHEGNYTGFRLAFAEAGQLLEPSAATSTVAGIEGAASKLVKSLGLDFAADFGKGLDTFLASSAVGDVLSFTTQVTSLANMIPGADKLGLTTALNVMSGGAQALVYAPGLLNDGVQKVTQLFGENGGFATTWRSMASLGSSFTSHTVPGVPAAGGPPTRAAPSLPYVGARADSTGATATQGRLTEAANAFAFQNLVRRAALVEVAYATPNLPLTSAQDAALAREQIVALFDAAREDAAAAGNDDTYVNLAETENAVIADLTRRMLQLPVITSFHTARSTNALTLAWRMYQDANRGDDVVARTAAINPAFLPTSGLVLAS
jgi:prophage DNA circulation protein